jgi:4-hydroxy-2-oxoglutarate aldolase
MHERLAGVLLPVTTAFDAVTGEVEAVHCRDNLRRWLEAPIDGFVLFGSTGEGALLDESEKVRLCGFARDVVPAGVVLVAGASGESTRAAARQTAALGAAGADAVLLHPPVYFGPYLSAAALRDYFTAVADASPIPVMLYHIPKYTKVTLDAGLVAELARHPNIVGLKDSSGDLKRLADYTGVCAGACRLFVGNGALFYAALELGADGGIMAAAVIAPAEYARLYAAFGSGATREAGALQERLAPVHKEIVAPLGAVGVKAALDLRGYYGGAPRPPLAALRDRERQAVARVMQEAGIG